MHLSVPYTAILQVMYTGEVSAIHCHTACTDRMLNFGLLDDVSSGCSETVVPCLDMMQTHA